MDNDKDIFKARLDLHRPLAPAITRRLHEDLRIRLTYHSNALEGNTLSLRKTQVVIEEGITIGGHSLREHLEATNHATAFDELSRLVEETTPITQEVLLHLHALVLHAITRLPTSSVTRPSLSVAANSARLRPPR